MSSILALLGSVFAATSATFGQAVLSDDAHITLSSQNGNFGSNPALTVSGTNNVFLKFKVAAVLPTGTAGNKIAKATVKLYVDKVARPGKIDVYLVAGEWSETTITANNAPPLGALIVTTTELGSDREGNFIVLDLTPAVRQWLGTDGQGTGDVRNNGIALVAHPLDAGNPQQADITFDSKENSQTSHEARLDVIVDASGDALRAVAHDATLIGDGTAVAPLGVAPGAITDVYLADGAVTTGKIADNAVGTTKLADGSVTSAKVAAPLSLTSGDANFTLSATNTGAGAAITAAGAINTTTQYNIGGNRVLAVTGNVFSATSNVFVGVGAGSANTTGGANSFFGSNAGMSNTTGSDNAFFGRFAGRLNTSGQFNAFFGNGSGGNNTTGSRNIFAGHGAGSGNISGGENSFFGVLAGLSNETGQFNTFIGKEAGKSYKIGSRNTFIGGQSGAPFTGVSDGNNNTAFGYRAWVAGELAFATAIGSQAVVDASDTIVIGKTAGTYEGVARPADTVQVPGALNVAGTFGANILDAATQFNIGGNRVLSVSGSQQFPNSNIFAGVGAGASNATGFTNSFFGQNAGSNNTGGNGNSFFGWEAGRDNTTASFNAFFGTNAGRLNTNSLNAFFGAFAGSKNTTGHNNAFFGGFAGIENTTGQRNSFFGESAGGSTTSGSRNTFVGQFAGGNNMTGGNNSFFGTAAGNLSVTGSSNTFIGSDTGFAAVNPTGNNNTLLGAAATVGTTNLSFATAVGAGAVVNTSNTVVLGRSADSVQIPGALNVAGAFGANILNAATQYNIGGERVLVVGGDQTFPTSNLFVGVDAGANNPTGLANSFFGEKAGMKTTQGNRNSFFGYSAGMNHTTGDNNSFFGWFAGLTNTGGESNSFFGQSAGVGNSTGSRNAFFGNSAGNSTTTGFLNTFVGFSAGNNNTTGNSNTVVGAFANLGGNNLVNAAAIGHRALVTQSDSLVLGAIAGVNGGTDTNVGIGTTAPKTKLHVARGKIYVEANGQGVILKSPGGSCFELTVTDAGALVTATAACP